MLDTCDYSIQVSHATLPSVTYTESVTGDVIDLTFTTADTSYASSTHDITLVMTADNNPSITLTDSFQVTFGSACQISADTTISDQTVPWDTHTQFEFIFTDAYCSEDVTYTILFTPKHLIPQNGFIEIDFPKQISVPDFSYSQSSCRAVENTAFSTN